MRKGWKNYYKMLYTIAIKSWDKFNANFVLLYFSSRSSIKMWHLIWNIWRNDKDNSREFTESAESTKNYNCLSSSINQPKNYPSTYSDSFSRILSVKNRLNFIFCQFRISFMAPHLKTKMWNSQKVSESFIHCTSDGYWFQCTDWSLDTIVYIQYRLLFKITLFMWTFFQTKNRNLVCPSWKSALCV